MVITWDNYNLTANAAASLTISLYGYKETTIRPQLLYIDVLEVSKDFNAKGQRSAIVAPSPLYPPSLLISVPMYNHLIFVFLSRNLIIRYA